MNEGRERNESREMRITGTSKTTPNKKSGLGGGVNITENNMRSE